MQGVYLLHFHEPISPNHTTQHYLGYADDVRRRVREHKRGQGARLTQVAVERGISFTLAQLWPGEGRHFERRLKNRHNGPKLCPICHPIPSQDIDFYTGDER